jgi:flagellin
MTVINTNLSAIAAQSSLRISGLAQTNAMERLSTGVRINSAKDDAAGLAISTRMTANIRGISAAIRNANDGISLTQTAEGSLVSIGDNLQRIRELAVQSANSSNNPSDLAALNSEAAQLISEIDRIANNSTFNGIKLMDGSYKDQSLQVGAGNNPNDRISISIGDARTDRLGAATTAEAKGVAITNGDKVDSGKITINGYNVAETTSDGVSIFKSEGSAISKANAINAISNKTGVVASATASNFTFEIKDPTSGGSDFKFLLNSVLIQGNAQGITNTGQAKVQTAQNVAAAINAKTAQTGVYANFDANGKFSLTAEDGRNIFMTINADEVAAVTGEDPTDVGATWGATGIADTATEITGKEAYQGVVYKTYTLVEKTADTSAAVYEQAYFVNDEGEYLDAADGEVVAAANKVIDTGNWWKKTATSDTNTTDIREDLEVDSTYPVAAVQARSALDFFPVGASTTDDSVVIFGGLELKTDSLQGIVIGGDASTLDNLGLTTEQLVLEANPSAGAGVGSVNLSKSTSAQSALTTLDRAINAITDMRASMGAYQNRLTAAIANLENSSMNLTASRSRILDTDYAKETTNLAKSQIIQQAATAMLAQANQSAQSVLALLK